MNKSETITKISASLLIAQKKMGGAKKDAVNPYFKSSYADLGAVMEACKDALNENGIIVLQPVGSDEIGVYVETVLLHESGEFISDMMRIAVKSPNDPQAQGSAITYARRYGLQSMVFIPAEDDDGEKAMKRVVAPAKRVEDGLTYEQTDDGIADEDVPLGDSPMCATCGEPAEEKRGKTKVGNKPYHGIFCSSGDKAHTKWINDK